MTEYKSILIIKYVKHTCFLELRYFGIESLTGILEDRGENGTENPLRLYQV